MFALALLQEINIKEKINNAPNSGYEIGVFIGTFLPFVVLIGLAYWMFSRAKKRNKDQF